MMRQGLLWLSEQKNVFNFVRRNGVARRFASRFVAGESITDAVDAAHAKVIVLLTDGKQVGGSEQDAYNAAAAARRNGITVFTIGVGPDAAEDFLVRVAGDPGRYYKAADEKSLLSIYRSIAGTLPCTIH